MIDPRTEAILMWSTELGAWQDKTAEIDGYRTEGGQTLVRFVRSAKIYRYGHGRLLILREPTPLQLAEGAWVEVCGERVPGTVEAHRFERRDEAWVRIFTRTAAGERHRLFPAAQVSFADGVEQTPQAAEVMAYLRAIVAAMPSSQGNPDPLQRPHDRLTQIHPGSVLARYLRGDPIEAEELGAEPIFPFSSNLTQRAAVNAALRFPVSVIEGPPGTGKTQTILNVIATLVADPGLTVGVVASNNAAVDNVRRKLDAEGVGYVVANLGNSTRRKEFFHGPNQAARNAAVDATLAEPRVDPPGREALHAVAERLETLQHAERTLAAHRQELDAYLLEREHFARFLQGQNAVAAAQLPLFSRSSDTLLEFLADLELERRRSRRFRWLRAIARRVKYGPLRGAHTEDTDLRLRVQEAFYDRRVAELEHEVATEGKRLEESDLRGLLAEHARLSQLKLRAGLRDRYERRNRVEYPDWANRQQFRTFSADYPVILSTCHSLRDSIGEDHLLDCLIIDESSQTDLPTAALAMASCRRIVVVGDERQLAPIVREEAARSAVPPAAAYDYRAHSIMSSLRALYGESLPVTMLREHYRCHPVIIGFCNEKFYEGRLIPLRQDGLEPNPMTLVRTSAGNHMRRYSSGGLANFREIDVIRGEVIPAFCAGIPQEEIGVVTPFRRQVAEVSGQFSLEDGLSLIETDTVHKYQGREKRAIVMSAVLDDTRTGRKKLPFVDEARLVNVAVSRAKERFILVTDHGMLPASRNLRDLVGYIRYRDPAQLVDSSIVSVFDLLYTNYSAQLRSLESRLRGDLEQRSEDIVWTVLQDLLAEERYRVLKVVPQVLLRHLVPGSAVLTPRQAGLVRRGSSLDIVVYNRLTRAPLLGIEVDGFAYHADNPQQLARDAVKDEILGVIGLPLLRLPTTGSGELGRIQQALDTALAAEP